MQVSRARLKWVTLGAHAASAGSKFHSGMQRIEKQRFRKSVAMMGGNTLLRCPLVLLWGGRWNKSLADMQE